MKYDYYLQHTKEIISFFQQGNSYTEIAKLLQSDNPNADFRKIKKIIRNNLGSVKCPRGYFYNSKICSIILNLAKQNYTPTSISKIVHIPRSAIEAWFRRKHPEISFLPNKGNVHYFHQIDTFSKAYIVGFIAADGCIANCGGYKSLHITVKYSDKEVLDFIKSEIGFEHPVHKIVKPLAYDKTRINEQAYIRLTHEDLLQDLFNLGITQRKSLTMPNIITNIPQQFRDAFILGYFDGDGCCYLPTPKSYHSQEIKVQILGTFEFLNGIKEHLNLEHAHIRKTHSKIHELYFTNKKDIIRFYKCYDNLKFYYKRKHDKFLQRINLPCYDKYR